MANNWYAPSSSSMHDGLASTLSEGIVELITMVQTQVIPHEWLTTVFVDPLQDLVPGGITKSREQREEFAANSRCGIVLEDDSIELSGRRDPALVAHKPLRNGIDLHVNPSACARELFLARQQTGWNTASSAIPADPNAMSQLLPSEVQFHDAHTGT
jgi:hypothetical protein